MGLRRVWWVCRTIRAIIFFSWRTLLDAPGPFCQGLMWAVSAKNVFDPRIQPRVYVQALV